MDILVVMNLSFWRNSLLELVFCGFSEADCRKYPKIRLPGTNFNKVSHFRSHHDATACSSSILVKFETRGPVTTEMTVAGIQNSTKHQEKSRLGTVSYTSHIFFKNVCPQSLIIFSVDVSAMHKTLKLHVFTRWVSYEVHQVSLRSEVP